MSGTVIIADNIVSPLGNTTAENFGNVKLGHSGIKQIEPGRFAPNSFYAAAFSGKAAATENNYTPFERLCIRSVQGALANCPVKLSGKETIFILSTTKGNISLLENEPMDEALRNRVALQHTAKTVAGYFKAANVPIVVSNACISGLLAVIVAKRLLDAGKYKHAVVTGADMLSRFVIAGFQSLHATSNQPCKPFDKSRNGITLGEGAATIVISNNESLADKSGKIIVHEGASSNDANHISGPSRTGNELAYAVKAAIASAQSRPEDIAFISAHGTATIYNDEMESKAFETAGLSEVPLHSLKGNYGHTLGAAGLIESVLSIQSLREGIVLPSLNYQENGVSGKVTVNKTLIKTNKKHALKTASGFGGCNAAILYSVI